MTLAVKEFFEDDSYLIKKYNKILTNNVVVVFVSLDGIFEMGAQTIIRTIEPEFYEKIVKNTMSGAFVEGKIIVHKLKNGKYFLAYPYKKSFNEDVSLDIINKSLEKLLIFKDKFNYNDFFVFAKSEHEKLAKKELIKINNTKDLLIR